ncbi:MFS transporter [uncultured Paludibaculum sp.]|uniref:MFS transporter n=1 Tax=uncultured Paludibaculum sp. TaxID=1765020 RepID=UPI002AAB3A03|nr:MFS transporter [uncultured Paludibaculum sp.]
MGSGTFRALRHRNFRLYAGGMTVSLAGTWMQQLAQSWLVYRLTHSEWMLGLTWFFANIPILLLSPITGLVADRYPRRRIVLYAQTAAMVQAVVLAALTLTGRIQVWHVLALASVLGIASAFDIPGRQALFVHLVGKEDLVNAISLNSAVFNSARVIGPPIAGFVVAAVGEGMCFAFNAFSFLAVIFSLIAMDVVEPPPQGPAETPLERLRQGFRYAWGTKAIRTLLITAGAASLAAAPASALAPVFAAEVFHRGAEGLGLLSGALGVGAILGTLSLAGRHGARGLHWVILISTLGMGGGFIIYAWSSSFPLSLLVMVFLGTVIFRQNAANNTAIQTHVEDHFRGRVMGLYSMMVIGMLPVGSLLSGAMASAIGSRWTTCIGGFASLFAAAFVYLNRRTLQSWLDL